MTTMGCILMLNKAKVGMLSVILCFMLGTSLCQASDTADALNSYKELQSKFLSNKNSFLDSHPEPTFLPSSERILSPFNTIPSSLPVNEEIDLTEVHSKEQVQDIEAINTIKQRTIVYDDVQRSDGENKGNSLDIGIYGNGKEKQGEMNLDDSFGNAIEEKVDFAMMSGANRELGDQTGPIRSQVNNLNIDVSGISVRAINTVPGGTAIATSNIRIEPVQIIVNPSEAIEKLK